MTILLQIKFHSNVNNLAFYAKKLRERALISQQKGV